MTSSDIIAIIAIIASAIVSIISVMTQYKSNKLALEAKRSELVFDKRLSAFQTVIEQVYNVEKVFQKWSFQESMNENDLGTFKLSLVEALNQGYETYIRHLVYIPDNIAKEIDIYLHATKEISDQITSNVKNGNSNDIMRNALLEHTKIKLKMIRKIRGFLGDK